MNKAQSLLSLIDEDGLNSVKSAISNVIDKLKVIAYKSGLEINTDLNGLKSQLFSNVDSQEKSRRVAPVFNLNPSSIVVGPEAEKKQEDGIDKQELFKNEYVKTMQAFISLLNSYKKNYSWIDVREIVEPMLKIEVKPRQ